MLCFSGIRLSKFAQVNNYTRRSFNIIGAFVILPDFVTPITVQLESKTLRRRDFFSSCPMHLPEAPAQSACACVNLSFTRPKFSTFSCKGNDRLRNFITGYEGSGFGFGFKVFPRSKVSVSVSVGYYIFIVSVSVSDSVSVLVSVRFRFRFRFWLAKTGRLTGFLVPVSGFNCVSQKMSQFFVLSCYSCITYTTVSSVL